MIPWPAPDAWTAACTLALERLIDHRDITLSDLQLIAVDLAQDLQYSVLTPVATFALYNCELS